MDEGQFPTRRRLSGMALILLVLLAWGTGWLQLVEPSGRSFFEDLYRVLRLFAINGEWVFEEDAGPALRILAFLAPIFTILTVIELVTRNFFQQLILSWQLRWMRNHFIICGLTEESLMVAKSLRQHRGALHPLVIDADPPAALAVACRRDRIPLIVGSPSNPEVLATARARRATSVVSFLAEAAESIRLILSINAVFDSRTQRKLSGEKRGINVWIKLDDTSFGLNLGEYFKLHETASHVQPRFFSLDEVAARRLLRFHAPDLYADAFGQQRIHLAIYGFNRLAIEIIEEVLIQGATRCPQSPRITILDEDPIATESALLAELPRLKTLTDVEFRKLHAYGTGIADHDYSIIPEDVTMHVVCYDRPEKATSTGLSLRRLSLVPPSERAADLKRCLNAPIFVRLARWRGLAQFLGSSVSPSSGADTRPLYRDRDIPDGIFAFGMVDDLLSADDLDAFVPTIIDTPREEIAKQIHFSYLEDRESLSSEFGVATGFHRRAELSWSQLAPEYRESCRQGADHIWTKARIIRSRICQRSTSRGADMIDTDSLDINNSERQLLAMVEHRRWINERTLSGWSFNEKRIDFARTHDLLRPWDTIPEDDAYLDLTIPERIQSGLKGIGLELKRELAIGVIGHRNRPDLVIDSEFVRERLRQEIDRLVRQNPDRSPVILTPLADGADSIAAEIAIEQGIPFIAVLPLPFEAYRQDFEASAKNQPAQKCDELGRFLRLVGRAERYLEMPLKFGDLIDVSMVASSKDVPEARAKQYALAAANIVERADELIAIWDGLPPKGIGGTGEAVGWRTAGEIPAEFTSDAIFYDRPPMKPPIIVSPPGN